MNNRSAYLIVILAISIIAQVQSQNKLELVTSLNKPTFLEGEPVWLKIQMVSKTGQSLPIYGEGVHCPFMEVVVKDSHGMAVPFRGSSVSCVVTGAYKPLTRASQYWNAYNLLESFGYTERIAPIFFFPAGNYTVQVEGEEGSILNDRKDSTHIVSNKVTITVRPPEGDEQKVRQLLLLAYSLKREPQNYDAVMRAFMDKYPDDPANVSFVRRYMFQTDDTIRQLKILDSLSHAHPNSLQMKAATRLKEMQLFKEKNGQ